ncbi:hypothetical protein A1359_03720 [Methylomonas lenta]|uniref:Uncharacterized protein n=1 Tax=Methylomonas lenta TaxID=980561 RepID=A0A177NNI5_9GAMM|nr:hypothetical protein [Methylomonas lenta]OAI19412.1 hypothetical protein A1359_03720 [Methylomonas lenta]
MYSRTAYFLFWVLLVVIVTALPYVILEYVVDNDSKCTDKISIYSTGLLQSVALAYFLYQAYSGAFFATTSIFLDIEEHENNSDIIHVIATIERGDKWLSEIKNIRYVITDKDSNTPREFGDYQWKSINFPMRNIDNNDVLRLAPKEKTSAPFIVKKLVDTKGFYIIAEVKYESVGWRIPAISYAKIYIPPA